MTTTKYGSHWRVTLTWDGMDEPFVHQSFGSRSALDAASFAAQVWALGHPERRECSAEVDRLCDWCDEPAVPSDSGLCEVHS